MKNKSPFPEWIVPVSVIAVVATLAAFQATKSLEFQVLDFATRFVPKPVERPEIVLLDADDASIQDVGQWPWGRNVHAEVIADLRSLGTGSVTFDIEFVDRGPVGVSTRERDKTLTAKNEELDQVFQALQSRQIGVEEAGSYARTLLEEGILLTARDNDQLLGQALKVFGSAYTTLNFNLKNDSPDAQAAAQWLENNAILPGVAGDLSRVLSVKTLRGAIVPIASQGRGAGVTNVLKDSDGTLRRIHLLYRQEGTDKVFGQLAFVPLWDRLGRPPIEVQPDRIVLKTSTLGDRSQPDRTIPLDPKGMMVLNWPHTPYGQSFHHVGVIELRNLDRAWESLRDQVEIMQNAQYFDDDLTGAAHQAEADRSAALASGDQAGFDAADLALADWRRVVAALASGPQAASLRTDLRAQAEDPRVPAEARALVPAKLAEVDAGFEALKNKLAAYTDLRASLEQRLKGALVFYGWTSVATSDIGVTPFDPVYFNVGTHATVTNTILNWVFLNHLPDWVGLVLGAVLALGTYSLLTRLRTLQGVAAGFLIFGGLVLGLGLFYSVTGLYVGIVVPGLIVFSTALGLTLVKFWGTEAERRFIRGAFGTYLSPEVIKQLEADPDRLHLGGEKKVLTAMFTDVKGFSTFSEQLDPNDLVTLLNHYLTGMSDLILDTQGTIDKFEGDAIIAFWGAPLPFEDHAPRAVQAALRIKAAETAMNERFLRDGLAPSPLLTRIGLNTGEMTVGNMGTARRMDYTMMGNAVNLAARLEGVNKQYNTWILTTQATKDAAGEGIVFRKLDRVRVVGISTPVRLYEVAAFQESAPPSLLETVSLFEAGVDLYELKDWAAAQKKFQQALKATPGDGPSQVFLDRAAKILKEGVDARWDGVYNLTSK